MGGTVARPAEGWSTACGAGNFLLVAYRELRKIETDIIVAIREREGQTTASMDVTWEQKLSIGQFYGFEINWWPAKIAETAMFLTATPYAWHGTPRFHARAARHTSSARIASSSCQK